MDYVVGTANRSHTLIM